MAIVKFDEQQKGFAESFVEQMNAELKKHVDKMVADFTENAIKEIKAKANDIAIAGGKYIMSQCVMMPWQNGYEVRIFVDCKKDKES